MNEQSAGRRTSGRVQLFASEWLVVAGAVTAHVTTPETRSFDHNRRPLSKSRGVCTHIVSLVVISRIMHSHATAIDRQATLARRVITSRSSFFHLPDHRTAAWSSSSSSSMSSSCHSILDAVSVALHFHGAQDPTLMRHCAIPAARGNDEAAAGGYRAARKIAINNLAHTVHRPSEFSASSTLTSF